MKKMILLFSVFTLLASLSAQDVGIGTSNPDRPLAICANAQQEVMSFKNNSDVTQWVLSLLNGDGLRIGNASNPNAFVMKSNGYVGLGVADPLTRLQIAGILQSTYSYASSGAGVGAIADGTMSLMLKQLNPGTTTLIRFQDNPLTITWNNQIVSSNLRWGTSVIHDILTLTAGGLVGIGVPNPTDKLHVGGNIHLTGNLEVEGRIDNMLPVQLANSQLSDGWQNYNDGFAPVSYYKDKEDVVKLTGLIKNGTGPDILDDENGGFVLPAGYRPQYTMMFTVITGNNGFTRVDVRADGTIAIIGNYNSGYVSLDGIAFRAFN